MSTLSRLAGHDLVRSVVFLLVIGTVLSARPVVAQDADHLIISEIVTTVGRFGAQFVEVVNPTASAIPMQGVHLTNATNVGNGTGYWRLVEEAPGGLTAGGGSGGVFHGRFPDGYELAAGDTLVVSITGSADFQGAYDGNLPDFEVFEDGLAADAVPELVEVFPGSINGGAISGGTNPVSLGTGAAGSLMLYQWDGTTDLVADLDYAHWGTNQSFRVDKTGVTIGSGSYVADTAVGGQIPLPGSAGDGRSYMRGSADEGAETTPGNGLTGHDETSENLGATWSVVTPQDPATPAATPHPSAPILAGVQTVPALPYSNTETYITLLVSSHTAMMSVQVSYTIDDGAAMTVAATPGESDGEWTAVIPPQQFGAVVAWWAEMTNADGGTAVYPSAAPRFTDGWIVDVAPEKLLISEVNAGENFYPSYEGLWNLATEFVEIHNPNNYPVDCSDYYLTDAINHYFGSQLYWQIAQGPPHTYDAVGGGNYNDFTARFPDGYVIEAYSTIIIAIAGSEMFERYYMYTPDLELYEDDPEPDDIPDMRPVFVNPDGEPAGNSIYTPDRTAGSDGIPRGIPELEEFYGEPVILYHWKEGSDLVTDIDFFAFSNSKTDTERGVAFDKTGVTVGSSTYLPDTRVNDQEWWEFDPFNEDPTENGTKSYTRVDTNEGDQVTMGGNGVAGRDETSENMLTTFAIQHPSPGFFFAGKTQTRPVQLDVPARTFLPTAGEVFPIRMVSQQNADTKLRLFDLEGRLVNTLWDSRFDGDVSPFDDLPTIVEWDGRDETYERVRAGMYIVHMSVLHHDSGEETVKTAPVVVATRLSR